MKHDKIQFDQIVTPVVGHFHGGIHPEEFKHLSNEAPIQILPLAKNLILPIQQSIGQAGKLVVSTGDLIVKGQLLVDNSAILGANIHAPLNGEIVDITESFIGHPSGMLQPVIKIQCNDNANQPDEYRLPSLNWEKSPPDKLLQRIKAAGIVGLGGATFPTHIKLAAQSIQTLIVNAMECEPYITCDDRLLQEQAKQVINGAQIAAKIIGAERIIFAIEDNKSKAIHSLREQISALSGEQFISVMVAPTKYPSGGEKQTIELVTGRQLPANSLPASIGVVIQNVATLQSIFHAVTFGIPLTSRLITLTGNLIGTPGNYWIPFGTSIAFIMQTLRIINCDSVIIGGPLMGQSITDFSIPVTKATNCLIFNRKSTEDKIWLTEPSSHQECIRCAECETVCPVDLLPQQLYWFSQSDQWEKNEQQGLFDCIECGACAYVCPSKIPLVHYYRYAKSNIRQIQKKHLISDKAKQRFEFREARLAREKIEKSLKHKKAAEARKKAAQNDIQDPTGKQNAINEALARVKQKKANAESGSAKE